MKAERKDLRPYSIKIENNGKAYNFHGFDRYGRPMVMIGYASFDTRFYWRTYKHCGNAIKEMRKIKQYYAVRKMDYMKVYVYDNLADKKISEI